MASQKLSGQVAIVTGASSGIGRAIAVTLANNGAKVVVADIIPAPRSGGYDKDIKPTDEEIRGSGNESIYVKTDVSSGEQVANLVKTTVDTFGRVDILVNCAGVLTPYYRIHEQPESDWDRTININLKSIYLTCREVIPHFLKNDIRGPTPGRGSRGKVVNIASVAGLIARPIEPAYVASKAGVVGLTKNMAIDYSRDRINFNYLCPAATETAMMKSVLDDKETGQKLKDLTPWPDISYPEDIAQGVLFLCLPENYVMQGASLVMDGGFSM